MNKMDNETREEANKKYAEWQAVVRSKGYISELSKLLQFIAFSDENYNWLEIKFKAGTVRMDITENRIKVVGPFLRTERTAMNAAEITFISDYVPENALLKKKLAIALRGLDEYADGQRWSSRTGKVSQGLVYDVFFPDCGGDHGYELARQIKAEIEEVK